MADPKPLRLLAQDPEDLDIISAAMQDAVLKVGEIAYEKKAKRLTIAFNRYRWEAGGGARVRSGLQFAGVLQLQARKIRRGAPDAVLKLSVTTPPGADLRATVECVEAVLADVSEPWPTPRTPAHEV